MHFHTDMGVMWSLDTTTCETSSPICAVVPTYLYELKLVEGSYNYARPADVLVDGWDRAKPAAFDVTFTSPLTPVTLNEASIHEGAAALAAETRKHAANDARCQVLGWSCIPLAVETFGNRGREAQCVFSLPALRQGQPKSTVVRDIYGHLRISLVRSVARSIMGREIVN